MAAKPVLFLLKKTMRTALKVSKQTFEIGLFWLYLMFPKVKNELPRSDDKKMFISTSLNMLLNFCPGLYVY